MIATVSMNPAIDRTLSVPRFEYGGMNRVGACRDEGSGKAVNVALVAAALGADARCVGLLPESGGEMIARRLFEAGAGAEFIATPGAVRVNMKLIDESTGVATELNQGGAPVDEAILDALGALLKKTAAKCDYMALTGSLPPGAPPGYYADLALSLGGACRVALDAEGEPFRRALASRPFLVKPNRMELELALDRRIGSLGEALAAARELVDTGIQLALVSLGSEGALLVGGGEALFAPALSLEPTSTVGAGDSMLAGALVALSGGKPLDEALRYGAAAAAASVTRRRGGPLVDLRDFLNYLDRIDIRRL